MFRSSWACVNIFLCLCVGAASEAHADLVITVDHVTANVGDLTAVLQVHIATNAGDTVTDMVGFVQIDDGGTLLGNPTDGPMISAIDLSGTIWQAAPSSFTSFFTIPDFDGPPPSRQVVDPNVSLNSNIESVLATGTLFSITVDLASGGFADAADVGTVYSVFLGGPSTSVDTLLENSGSEFITTIHNGSITVVPEPSLAPLLGVLAVGVVWPRLRAISKTAWPAK